jgi:hypothetical protein
VEVHIRNKSGSPNSTVGVSLARQAFHLITGPLTDMTVADRGEREARMHLFAGLSARIKTHLVIAMSISAIPGRWLKSFSLQIT